MDYEYDVFLSYSRSSGNVSEWVWNHFYPLLASRLEDETGNASIFIDRDLTERQNARWPDQLAAALQKSRLLVAVLSAPYFRSPWCVAEWRSMEEREAVSGFQGLIIPVVFAGESTFPESVRNRQLYQDFRNYNIPYLKYRETESYLDFDREVRHFALLIADRLTEVPDWNADWPVLRPPPLTSTPDRLPRFGA
ncbi:TIR domain-containing protein [Streptomyces sp. NPDC046909]|uniref:TIR domain-containing protein n=1 Tax=Streptomyces sp. NPDC046909 TaxID=3155617 RepID=UPI00340CFA01